MSSQCIAPSSLTHTAHSNTSYRTDKVKLLPGTPGGALDSTSVRKRRGKLSLEYVGDSLSTSSNFESNFIRFNPGRIDPTNEAWTSSRKPLVAAWETRSGATLFTINVHFSSKDGSSSTQGDARPFVNGAVNQRTGQVKVAAVCVPVWVRLVQKKLMSVQDFINSILALDKHANIVIAGDFNEFAQTRSVFAPFSEILTEIDESSGLDPVERYTYIFDQNCQQLVGAARKGQGGFVRTKPVPGPRLSLESNREAQNGCGACPR